MTSGSGTAKASDELRLGIPLSREALYRLIADEVCRDGVVEAHEKLILEKMAQFLRLESEEARRIATEAWESSKDSVTRDQGPLDPRKLYTTALRFAGSDGTIDPLEEQMLAGLRRLFRLSDDDHKAILKELTGDETPEAPTPRAQVTLPAPGSTTVALAQRLDHDPLEAWTNDHRYWFPLQNQASDPARAGWEKFLRGMGSLNEGLMYDGLDALDDVLNSLDEIRIVDVILALAALRWSRVLLKTAFASDDHEDAREWPGRNLYQRLCVKMGPILISIDHLRNKAPLEEGLAMTVVYLLEDLCMLVQRRHEEALGFVGGLLPQVARISPKSQVTHQAVALIGPLTSMVARQGGAMVDGFVGTCREICRCMPQNHPLTVAAHGAIMTLAPQQALFPASYKPRINTSSSPSFPQAVQRLDRLIVELSARDEEEELFVKALSGADLSPIDTIRSAAVTSYRENKLDPDQFLFRNLVAMIFPVLGHLSRPVVAFFTLGHPGGHHEELKGGWVPLLLKRLDGNGLQAIPDFPIFPSTSLLSIPLDEKSASALSEALDRSGGAYDVVLVDPGRKGARIWHQTGDLDPTGTLFRVERDLLPAEKYAEAERTLDQALSRHPWLSRAWVHKGLLAKRAGDLTSARQAFDRALEVQPHDPHALTRLGVLDKGETRMESSEKTLRQALRILPTESSAIVTLAALTLGRVAGGESAALPMWDYYVAGLHAARADGQDFREIAAVGDSLDPALSRIVRFTPVDTVFYL